MLLVISSSCDVSKMEPKGVAIFSLGILVITSYSCYTLGDCEYSINIVKFTAFKGILWFCYYCIIQNYLKQESAQLSFLGLASSAATNGPTPSQKRADNQTERLASSGADRTTFKATETAHERLCPSSTTTTKQ